MTVDLLDFHVEAIHFGPTWERRADWDGVDALLEYVLPERTLGWQAIDWVGENLLSDEADEYGDLMPFRLTREQTRFILWWYAIDDRGRFVYRDGVLQRLKGWGKDPVAAVISAIEFVGPCRFARWASDSDAELYGLEIGDPIGVDHPRAWIQIAAVSMVQTANTMKLFPGIFTKACIKRHSIDIGKETIYAYHGQRTIQAVTSSPRALEGGRPTFVVRNETHHWLANNEGHDMSEVIERNATKSKGGAARALSITNAYEPSEDSVAQRQREAWEAEVEGLSIKTGMLYDSLEAPADARLAPDLPPELTDDEREAAIKAYVGAVIKAVRGDATWLDVEGIVDSILRKTNSPSISRRFWYNQIVASEDAWVLPLAVDIAEHGLAKDQRASQTADVLRVGWDLVLQDEPVVMFFDGSKSGDATALVGCRLSDGYVFTLGVWAKPPGIKGNDWRAPRDRVDERVIEVEGRFNVVAFWADPSHALDDEDGERYWDGLIDTWHRRYKDRLTYWAAKTGDRAHSIMWDMTSPERSRQFTEAAMVFVTELETRNDIEELEPSFSHDGHPALKAHLKHAKRYPNRWGVSLWKGGRESKKKIDLAVCAVGARMLRRLVLNRGLEDDTPKQGEVWGSWR